MAKISIGDGNLTKIWILSLIFFTISSLSKIFITDNLRVMRLFSANSNSPYQMVHVRKCVKSLSANMVVVRSLIRPGKVVLSL